VVPASLRDDTRVIALDVQQADITRLEDEPFRAVLKR